MSFARLAATMLAAIMFGVAGLPWPWAAPDSSAHRKSAAALAGAGSLLDALRADDACLRPGGGVGSRVCALGAMQLKAQVAPSLGHAASGVASISSSSSRATSAGGTSGAPARQPLAAAPERGRPAPSLVQESGRSQNVMVLFARMLAGTQAAREGRSVSGTTSVQTDGELAATSSRVPLSLGPQYARHSEAEGGAYTSLPYYSANVYYGSSKMHITAAAPIMGVALMISSVLAVVFCNGLLSRQVLAEREATLSTAGQTSQTFLPVAAAPKDSSTRAPSSEEGDMESLMSSTSEDKSRDAGAAKGSLFRYASPQGKILMALALLVSMVHGACMPLAFFFMDRVFQVMNLPNDDGTVPPALGPHEIRDQEVWRTGSLYLMLGGVAFLARTSAIGIMVPAAGRTVSELRQAYFAKLLRQGPAWHDLNNGTELSMQLAQDSWYLKQALSMALVDSSRGLAMFISALLVSFHRDWQMTCVMLVALPVAATAIGSAHKVRQDLAQKQGLLYIKAGAVAEGALQMVRTVWAFNGQKRTLRQYEEHLNEAEGQGTLMGLVVGFSNGVVAAAGCFGFSLALYVGSIWILKDWEQECWASEPPFGTCRTGGSIFSSMFTLLWAFTLGLGSLGPGFEAIAQATSAVQRLYSVIDAPVAADTSKGMELPSVEGAITYENVHFAYPSRREVTVLVGLSLRIPAGSTTAFVGPSGSGKSTLISLLLRFYEPQAGRILLDAHDTRNLKLSWLRSKMALVEQEPVLFDCSISQNVAYGREEPRREDIVRATKLANAHGFIADFPAGYDTEVGERGTQLSGGQKQRVAIARALIREPAVLLLDEATSALDTESEKVVQEALDQLLRTRTRTTLVIAHRLNTVQNADQICVLKDGQLAECGTHSELVHMRDSLYSKMAGLQSLAAEEGPGRTHKQGLAAATDKLDATSLPVLPAVEGSAHPPAGVTPAGALLADTKAPLPPVSPQAAASPAPPAAPAAKAPKRVSLGRLIALSRPEFCYYALGLLLSVLLVLVVPFYLLSCAQAISLINQPPVRLDTESNLWVPSLDEEQVSTAISSVCLIIQGTGLCFMMVETLQKWFLEKAGSQFTTRIRLAALGSMFRQEMAWFDINSPGSLATQLASDAPAVKALVGGSFSTLFQNIVIVAFGIGGSLFFCWRLVLCLLGVMPLLAIGAAIVGKAAEWAGPESLGGLVAESVRSIKTVAAFGLEARLGARFEQVLRERSDVASRLLVGLGSGVASAAVFLMLALMVLFGNKFVNQGTVTPQQATISVFVLLGSVGSIAEIAKWFEQSTQARAAADTLFELIDRSSSIDSMSNEGRQLDNLTGRVEFKDIHFWYPARPDVPIFQGFNLTVAAHSTVALVGHSGSGKSTLVALLQRFYDPQRGAVLLDGHDIRTLSLSWLRQHMALVQQEPVLFGGTVLDNIRYSCEQATDEAVMAASRMANAHDFVSELPGQYSAHVGFASSTQLSGGQKQRLAIARAMLRDPQVLLLDEATSALDSESERVVQQALDELLKVKGRTTIVIAHRLSTVRNASQICHMQQGRVLEQGTHAELMRIPNGHYMKLVGRQMVDGPELR